MRRGVSTTVLLIASLCSAAQGAEYYYFNKPDVARIQYVMDKLVCDRLAGGVLKKPAQPTTIYVAQSSNLTATQNAIAVGVAALFAGLIIGNENRKIVRAVERTCMADKGYGRFLVDKSVVRAIDKLQSEEERVDRYFALATAVQPIGKKVKE